MLATEDVFPNIREIDINSNYETDTSEQPLSLTLGPSICFQGVLREGTLICTIWVTSWRWAGKYEPSEKAEHSLVSQVQEKHTKVSTFIEVLYLTSLARKYNLTWHYILPIHGNGYKLKLQKMSSLFVFHVSPIDWERANRSWKLSFRSKFKEQSPQTRSPWKWKWQWAHSVLMWGARFTCIYVLKCRVKDRSAYFKLHFSETISIVNPNMWSWRGPGRSIWGLHWQRGLLKASPSHFSDHVLQKPFPSSPGALISAPYQLHTLFFLLVWWLHDAPRVECHDTGVMS